MKRPIVIAILLVALQLMPLIIPAGTAVATTRDVTVKDIGAGPSGRATQQVWKDDYSNFSKTIFRGTPLYISNGKVMVGYANVSPDADQHTIVLFHFDEGSGSTAIDSGPNHINGTLNNMDPATDWVQGINGKALDFDGSDDFVELPSDTVYNAKNVTVEAWIYSRHEDLYSDKFIVWKRSGYYLMDQEFSIDTPSVAVARMIITQTYSWHYLAGTYDGATVRFYLNGKQIATQATGAGIHHDTNNLYIGAGNYMIYPFNGIIDEVRVQDKALGSNEINDTWMMYQAALKGYRAPRTHLLTQKIVAPQNGHWDTINVAKDTPSNTAIKVTVLDNATGASISGYSKLTGTTLDISGIDALVHPALQLWVDFTVSNSTATPALDSINVTCTHNDIPPMINKVTADGKVLRPGSGHIYVNVSDTEQPPQTLKVDLEAKGPSQSTWTKVNLANLRFDDTSQLWIEDFVAGPTTDIGPYSIKVTLTNDLALQATGTFDNLITVYSDAGASVELEPKGLAVLRGAFGNLSILPHMSGSISDLALTVSVLRGGTIMPWCNAPYIDNDHFVMGVHPPLSSVLGNYDVHVSAVNKVTYSYVNVTLKDGLIVKNNPPIWTAPAPFQMDEDTSATFDIIDNVADIDGPLSNITIQVLGNTLGSDAAMEMASGSLHITSLKKDWAGNLEVSLNISDGMDAVSQNITIQVNQTPDIPVLGPINDMRVYETTVLYYNFTAYDPDPGTTLLYYLDLGISKDLLGTVAGYSFDDNAGTLVLPLTNDMVGQHSCSLAVTDGLFIVARSFGLTVINVNDPPQWAKVPTDGIMNTGQTFNFDVNATDIDKGDTLLYLVNSTPETQVSIEARSGHLTFTPQSFGIYFITITVGDGTKAIHHEFKMEVRKPGANTLPEATLVAPKAGTVVELVNPLFEWTLADPDSTNVTANIYLGTDRYGVSHLDPKYLVGKDLATKRFIPTEFLDKGGVYYWTVIPIDQSSWGSCKDGVWSFKVSDSARTNHPPVIELVKPQTVTAGQSIKVGIKATDEDGDTLTYSIVDGPSDASVSSGGQLTWKGSKPMKEPYLITVAVSDGRYITTTTVEVRVQAVKTIVDGAMATVLAIIGIVIACVVVVAYKMGSKKRMGGGPQ